NLRDIRHGGAQWSSVVVRELLGNDVSYREQSLVAVGLWVWGGFLIIKACVQGSPVSLLKGVAIVLASTVLGTVVGCTIGVAIGTFAPTYYADLYPKGRWPPWDPVAMGLYVGVT